MRTFQGTWIRAGRTLAAAVLGGVLFTAADCGAQERSWGRDYSSRDRDYSRDRSYGSDRGSSSSYGSSSSSHSSSSSGSSTSSASSTTPHTANKVRVTMGLQSNYVDLDTDHDNQIGLYEWKKAKKPLAQFTQLDTNRDGFLTPRELERAGSLPALPSTTSPSTSTLVTTGSPATTSPAAATPAASTQTVVVSKLSEEDQAKADEAQGKSIFSVLDKDHDGKITAAEMASSTRIRPLFEQAGIKFEQPMASEEFVSNYVRIQKSKRPEGKAS